MSWQELVKIGDDAAIRKLAVKFVDTEREQVDDDVLRIFLNNMKRRDDIGQMSLAAYTSIVAKENIKFLNKDEKDALRKLREQKLTESERE